MAASKPPASYIINTGDALGDVAFCVPVLEGSGNTLKEYVTGITCTADSGIGSAWSTIDGGVDWTGACLDINDPTATNRPAAQFNTLSNWPSIFSSTASRPPSYGSPAGYAGPLTTALIAKIVHGTDLNNDFRHLSDLQGNGTSAYSGYANFLGTAGRYAATFRDSSGNVLSAGNDVFDWDTATDPYMCIITTWPAGTSAGVTVYNNLNGSGQYSSTMAQAFINASTDAAHSLYPGSPVATGINAIGGWGSNPPHGFHGKFVTYMAWARVLSSTERQDFFDNPWRMLKASTTTSPSKRTLLGVGS